MNFDWSNLIVYVISLFVMGAGLYASLKSELKSIRTQIQYFNNNCKKLNHLIESLDTRLREVEKKVFD